MSANSRTRCSLRQRSYAWRTRCRKPFNSRKSARAELGTNAAAVPVTARPFAEEAFRGNRHDARNGFQSRRRHARKSFPLRCNVAQTQRLLLPEIRARVRRGVFWPCARHRTGLRDQPRSPAPRCLNLKRPHFAFAFDLGPQACLVDQQHIDRTTHAQPQLALRPKQGTPRGASFHSQINV